MKKITFSCMLMTTIVMIAANLFADTFSVQGVLRDPMGKTVADGNYSMTFRLFAQATGGTAVWEETQGSVAVLHGVYSAELGTVTPLTDVEFNTTYWLGLSIEGGTELEPRFKLTTTPASMSVLGTDNVFPSKGNVGIGTHTPNAALHVKNKNSENNVLLVEDTNGNPQVNTTASGQLGVGTAPAADLHIKTGNSTDKMLIEGADGANYVVVDATGKMGVNVETPAQALDIDGNIKMRNGGIMFDDGSTLTSAKMGGSASSVSNEGTTLITSDSDNNGTGNIDLITGSTTRMTVNSNGNVGIGTTSPAYHLDVSGYIRAQRYFDDDTDYYIDANSTSILNNAAFIGEIAMMNTDITGLDDLESYPGEGLGLNHTTGGNVYLVNGGGKVGIGTDAPSTKVHVYSLNPTLFLQSSDWNGAGDYGKIQFGDEMHYIQGEHTNGMTFNDPDGFYFKTGNVGIHDASPSYTLDVAGDINLTGTLYQNGSPFSTSPWNRGLSYISYTDGNVGIGTDNPEYKLDVDGSAKFNTSGSFDVIIETNGEECVRPHVQNYGFLGTEACYWYKLYVNNAYIKDQYTFSDRSVKNNIRPVTSGLDKILRLKGVYYDINTATHPIYKNSTKAESPEKLNNQLGFIAQDLQEVIPEMVVEDESTGYLMIKNYEQLFPVVVEAIKELKAELNQKDAIIKDLLKRVDSLEKR